MTGSIAAESLRRALPALLGNLDDATFDAIRPHLPTAWVECDGGTALFHEGDPSDCLYLVLGGRLRASVAGPDGGQRVVGEIGRGECVGEMGAFTGDPRHATVVAVRDTVLARIDLASLGQILRAAPALALNVNRVVIDRLQRRNASAKPAHTVRNVAVLAVTEGLRAGPALGRLVAELGRQGVTAAHLTAAGVDGAAGRADAAQAGDDDPDGHRWLADHLDGLEAAHRLVFYEADAGLTAWTRRCLRVADEVLLVADATAPPEPSAAERFLDGGGAGVGRTLVLVQPTDAAWPAATARFLAARPGVGRHLHVRLEVKADVARLARWVSGRAVGLVLAGGGARGLAHIGVFRALEEAGVPVDAVGGTSIGSVLGACVAAGWGWERVSAENRGPFLSNPTADFNLLPLVSLLAGRKLGRILNASPLAGLRVEDLWLPYFCVSSNFTRARPHVHTSGDLRRAVTASMAIPGVFPPVVHGDDLLVDGGVLNNMPVDVMAATGVGKVVAVDLRPEAAVGVPLGFTDVPGTWALIRDRLRPAARRRYPVPSMLAMLTATPFLSSAGRAAAAAADVDVLFRPDVSGFGMLEWRSFDALVEVGYQHARATLAARGPV